MAKYNDTRKYNLYEYTTNPHDTSDNEFGFLTNLNSMWTISTDVHHTTRKLIAKDVTREDADKILHGKPVVTIAPCTFPSGANGIRLIMRTYTLERDGVINYINPGIDEVIHYNGNIYRPVNASACWARVDE